MASESMHLTPPPVVRLHRGVPLKVKEISTITRRAYTPIIFLTGDVKCGKTTLLGSIHDAFQLGPLAGYNFAGSETLMGFEEKCFESRVRSGRTTPDTPRTRPQEGLEFFHLRLRKEPSAPFHELLFADMSGEFYERATNNAQELKEPEYEIVPRCDFVLLLLDGKRLMDDNQRHQVRTDALIFVQRCKEANILRHSTVLQVLISKWDAVARGTQEDQERCYKFVTSRFNPEYLQREVEVVRIASRPDSESEGIEKLFGIRELFPNWVEAVPAILKTTPPHSTRFSASRMFNRIMD
jgi:Double-GTPase 2